MKIPIITNFKNFVNLSKRHGFFKACKIWKFYAIILLNKSKINWDNPIVDVNDYKLSLIPNDEGISTELILFKTHEPLNTKLLANQLKKEMTCLDIGANIGYYALLESKIVGKTGKIIAIEPSPINFNTLKKNVKLNSASNIDVFHLAGGNEDGKIKFILDKQSNLSRIVSENEINQTDNIVESPIRKLDPFVEEQELKKLDFLRMDVEGYENKIYDGLRRSIKKFKPYIQVEIHTGYLGEKITKEFLEKLKEDGYETEYYIVRELDLPTVADMNDVKKIQIDSLLKMLKIKKLPSAFLLFLK